MRKCWILGGCGSGVEEVEGDGWWVGDWGSRGWYCGGCGCVSCDGLDGRVNGEWWIRWGGDGKGGCAAVVRRVWLRRKPPVIPRLRIPKNVRLNPRYPGHNPGIIRVSGLSKTGGISCADSRGRHARIPRISHVPADIADMHGYARICTDMHGYAGKRGSGK